MQTVLCTAQDGERILNEKKRAYRVDFSAVTATCLQSVLSAAAEAIRLQTFIVRRQRTVYIIQSDESGAGVGGRGAFIGCILCFRPVAP